MSNGLGRVESESESHSVTSDFLQLHGLYSSWNSPGQNTRMGSHFLLQGIFPTEGTNPGLLHCRQILYHLSHQGNLQIPMKLLQLAIMRTCYHPQVRGVREQQAMNPGESKKRRPAELDSAFTQWGTS